MMNENEMGHWMDFGTGFGWPFGLLVLVVVALAVVVAIKYLRK